MILIRQLSHSIVFKLCDHQNQFRNLKAFLSLLLLPLSCVTWNVGLMIISDLDQWRLNEVSIIFYWCLLITRINGNRDGKILMHESCIALQIWYSNVMCAWTLTTSTSKYLFSIYYSDGPFFMAISIFTSVKQTWLSFCMCFNSNAMKLMFGKISI